MIDVLIKMINGEIENRTVLKIYHPIGKIYYTFNSETTLFYNGLNWELDHCYKLDDKFLNFDVKLIPPKPKKYYLRLSKNDSFSYVNWDGRSSCEFATKQRNYFGYKTKFTQEEIDGCEFLKFVEKYGVKEDVEVIDVFVKQANKEIKEGTIWRVSVPDEELFGKKSVILRQVILH